MVFIFVQKLCFSLLIFKVGIFDLIWPNFGAPWQEFWPKILLKSQIPHVCPGSSPLGLNIDRCIIYNWKKPELRSLNDLWTTDLSSWGTPLWLAGPGFRTHWGVFPLSPLNLHLLHRCLPTKAGKNNTTAVTGLSLRVATQNTCYGRICLLEGV